MNEYPNRDDKSESGKQKLETREATRKLEKTTYGLIDDCKSHTSKYEEVVKAAAAVVQLLNIEQYIPYLQNKDDAWDYLCSQQSAMKTSFLSIIAIEEDFTPLLSSSEELILMILLFFRAKFDKQWEAVVVEMIVEPDWQHKSQHCIQLAEMLIGNIERCLESCLEEHGIKVQPLFVELYRAMQFITRYNAKQILIAAKERTRAQAEKELYDMIEAEETASNKSNKSEKGRSRRKTKKVPQEQLYASKNTQRHHCSNVSDVQIASAGRHGLQPSGNRPLMSSIYMPAAGEEVLSEDTHPPVAVNPAEDEEDNKLCAVCLSEPKEMALIPCGHVCLCTTCVDIILARTQDCPICRSATQGAMRVFFGTDRQQAA